MLIPVQARRVPAWLVAVSLAAVFGCGESRPGPDTSQRERSTNEESADAESTAPREPASGEQAEDSGVKLASAENRVARPQSQKKEHSAEESEAQRLEPPRELPSAPAPLPLDNVDAADLVMPKVHLTEHHKATCLLGVGDAFPDLELPTPGGQRQALSKQFGERLTLVVFWNAAEPTALEQLSDLARYHQPRFRDQGLAIVAINTGDAPQKAAELGQKAGADFTILSDADGAALKQVATEQTPRSYLLDPTGKILWFDLEYSATTRRDLVAAIRFSLARE